MKIRQDAWTEENDLLLAETVLRHVREGSTQLNAFEEVGDRLDRTSAACGFRWNSVVRQQYEQALSLARKQRKQRQRMLGTEQSGKKKILYQPPTLSDFESYSEMLEQQLINVEVAAELAPPVYSQKTVSASLNEELNLDAIILYLQNFRKNDATMLALKSENERLRLEIKELFAKTAELEKQLGHAQKNSFTMQEDYETLINIMNKARKMAMIEEDDRQATKFKMDRNGNLEKIAE